MTGMTNANNTLGLVTEEDGTQTIESRRGGWKLALRRAGNHYLVGLSDRGNRLERAFGHWRPAALAFAMYYHTERSLSSLGGQR